MISCQQYDYIEVACLYQIPVKLTLLSGKIIEGKAMDTRYNENKKESIVIHDPLGEVVVPTEELLTMQALIANTHFDTIQFTQTT